MEKIVFALVILFAFTSCKTEVRESCSTHVARFLSGECPDGFVSEEKSDGLVCTKANSKWFGDADKNLRQVTIQYYDSNKTLICVAKDDGTMVAVSMQNEKGNVSYLVEGNEIMTIGYRRENRDYLRICEVGDVERSSKLLGDGVERSCSKLSLQPLSYQEARMKDDAAKATERFYKRLHDR